MAAHGARRLVRMVDNATYVVAIEALVAAQACDLRAPLASSVPLEAAKKRLRQDVPMLQDDRYMAADLAKAFALVASGDFSAATGRTLPGAVA
jgi:histidine ammonia-lyase